MRSQWRTECQKIKFCSKLSLKFQKARTKIEVFLSLPCRLSQFNRDRQQGTGLSRNQNARYAGNRCNNNLIFSGFFQRNAKDVSYFDSAFTEDDPLLTPLPDEFITNMDQEQFKGFSYTDPNYALPAL